VRVVGIVLLHDEDVYAERVIRNVAAFCDRVYVADHASKDGTWRIVSGLAAELDNVEAVRISHAARSHDLVLPYVGTDTWVLSPDGDELFDPDGLRRLREELEAGRYRDSFRLFPAMLHCIDLDAEAMTATGYLAPPALSGPKLFNFAALESWDRVYRERLHEGEPVFRDGWQWTSVARLDEDYAWDENPFRCLHTCFLRRSSRDAPDGSHTRLNIAEANTYRRDLRGSLARRLRGGSAPQGAPWKLEKYRRGPLVTKDTSPFVGRPAL
jgi:glycosyltransferase involved in cell wall biosynthesis